MTAVKTSVARMKVVAVASMAAFAAGCTPDAVDAGGEGTGRLYDIFSAIAAAVFVVTAGLILWSILRYRRRRGDDSLPVQTHSHVALEVVWFAIPQLIVVFLFLISVGALGIVDRDPPVDEDGSGETLVVEVQGFQWGWRFDFPEADVQVVGTAEAPPEIYLPVGIPISFELRSEDVIHSFYVPRFLTKRDVVPGYDNQIEITITEEGTYDGKCAEFCGLLHGEMNFSIVAVNEAEFSDWLESRE